MSWVFHVLWLILVIVLFFLILRRIYMFGMQGREEEHESRRSNSSTNQQFYIFTIYDSRNRPSTTSTNQPQANANYEPPCYDDVIKSPDLYQKPPAYNQV